MKKSVFKQIFSLELFQENFLLLYLFGYKTGFSPLWNEYK